MNQTTFKLIRFIAQYPMIIQRIFYSLISNKVNYETYREIFENKKGLEIGGPSQIFKINGPIPIYNIVKSLDGCNFSENTVWEGKIEKGDTYNYYDSKKGYQYICDSVDLSALESNYYDFILSSHVLEHIANPFKAITEWLRVLKDNGHLLMILPHKDGTFDHNRPVTSLKHLIDDYESEVKEDDLTHLSEILELHDFSLHDPTGDFESFKERRLSKTWVFLKLYVFYK